MYRASEVPHYDTLIPTIPRKNASCFVNWFECLARKSKLVSKPHMVSG